MVNSGRFGRVARRAVEAGADLAALARFSRDLPGFLLRPIAAEVARARLQHGLAQREQRFLTMAERAIFRNSSSPYLPLLRHAGCEAGDLRALVLRDGLDAALRTLAAQGVYVAHDEVKGLRDAVRGSARFRFHESQFDSTLNPTYLKAETGGSSGTPTRVRRTLGLMDDMAGWVALSQEAHGLERPRHAFWMTGPVWWALIYGKLDQPVDGWFHPLRELPWQVRFGMPYLRLLGRLGGQRWPRPVACDLRQPLPLARWLNRHANGRQPVVLTTASSAAARVAVAARDAGISLRGVTFVVKSEPLTEARRDLIEAAEARVIVLYGSMEVPTIGSGCATPTTADDMHVATDLTALITRRRAVGEGGPTVDALLVSTLSPNAAKICFNVELGDYATVEDRDCDCLLGRLGLRTHLSGVRGFDKLTGEGVTFLRAHIETILEQVLPAQFGGTALDYQLVEEEAPNGTTRMILRIAPSVAAVDEALVRTALLQALAQQGGFVQRHMATLWQRAETVQVLRQAPLTTRVGKVLPFQRLQAAAKPEQGR
jgi:hypothetical protein